MDDGTKTWQQLYSTTRSLLVVFLSAVDIQNPFTTMIKVATFYQFVVLLKWKQVALPPIILVMVFPIQYLYEEILYPKKNRIAGST